MVTGYKHDAPSVHHYADKTEPRAVESGEVGTREGAGVSFDVEVREMLLADCGPASRLPHRYELMYPESRANRPGQFELIIRRLLSGEHSTSPILVARHVQTKQRLGMLQCMQQGVDDRWYLQYLCSQEEVDDGNTVPIALLEHAIAQAGSRGARRLMVRSSIDNPIMGILRSVGFAAFAREYVYALPYVPEGASARRVRMQEKSDVWSIHQLYLQTTPRDVQNAEALTSHVWDVDNEGRSRRGWFIPVDTGAGAYVRVRTTRKHHLLDAMCLPESLDDMPDLFRTVFHAISQESPRPVYVMVRGYQQQLGTVLESLGFQFDTDQLMMVRYTTVPVPASVRPVEAFERLRAAERDAQRVPSFCVRDMHE